MGRWFEFLGMLVLVLCFSKRVIEFGFFLRAVLSKMEEELEV